MSVAELIVVRHGESTANVAREHAELSGAELIAVEARDADVPLSDVGLRQAQALGRWLAQLPAEAVPSAVSARPPDRPGRPGRGGQSAGDARRRATAR
jgi:broad specificity phosphatase PhoE